MLRPSFLSAEVPGFVVAELTTDGLALCCFNHSNGPKYWEVAYPRHGGHVLTIKIQAVDEKGNDIGDPQSFRVDARVLKFGISLTNGSNDHYATFPLGGPITDGPFDRYDTKTKPHDLAWMIDVTGEEPRHGKFKKLKPKGAQDRPDVTLAIVEHSLFYVRKPSDEPVRISPRRENNPFGLGSFELGHTNDEMVGALFATSEDGEIRFVSHPAGSLVIPNQPYSRTRLYKIEIINMDTRLAERKEGLVKGDLHLFYDILEFEEKDKDEKDLWATPTKTGRFTPDGDCHANNTRLLTTLEDLIV